MTRRGAFTDPRCLPNGREHLVFGVTHRARRLVPINHRRPDLLTATDAGRIRVPQTVGEVIGVPAEIAVIEVEKAHRPVATEVTVQSLRVSMAEASFPRSGHEGTQLSADLSRAGLAEIEIVRAGQVQSGTHSLQGLLHQEHRVEDIAAVSGYEAVRGHVDTRDGDAQPSSLLQRQVRRTDRASRTPGEERLMAIARR